MSEPVKHGWKTHLGLKVLIAGAVLLLLGLGLCGSAIASANSSAEKAAPVLLVLAMAALALGPFLVFAGICMLVAGAIVRWTAIEVTVTDASGGVLTTSKKKWIGPTLLVGSIEIFMLGVVVSAYAALTNGSGQITADVMVGVSPLTGLVGLVMTIVDLVKKRKSKGVIR